ncbi:hypothetical protein [Enterobacter hormaechei]|uniref:hypothetical protein n=1 Tax=Enterobacter hormaechei TaxID=158836 RepID=UPI0034D284E1
MIDTNKIVLSGNQPFYFKTNIQATRIQITGYGGTGTLTLKAATTAETGFENVVDNEGDTAAITINMAIQKTIVIKDYSIYELEFIPSGAVTGTVIITQWWG